MSTRETFSVLGMGVGNGETRPGKKQIWVPLVESKEARNRPGVMLLR